MQAQAELELDDIEPHVLPIDELYGFIVAELLGSRKEWKIPGFSFLYDKAEIRCRYGKSDQ